MTRNEKDKIDMLLHHYYRDEASMLDLPDAQRCWQDFQKIREEHSPDNIYLDIPGPLADTVPLPGRIYRFVGRYRNITAAAAACFLVVMLLSGTPPMQMLRQYLTGAQPNIQELGTEDMAAEKFTIATEPAEPLPSGETGVTMEAADGQAGSLQPDAAQPAQPADEPPRQRALPPGVAAAGEGILTPAATAEEARELVFHSLHAYRTALQEYAHLIPGKIFYLGAPPGGYTFSRAAIHKTGTALYRVRQEFTGEAGDMLIIQQEFAAPDTVKMPPATAKAEARQQPQQFETSKESAVYGAGGTTYTISNENGLITLQYSLDNSVLMLTAALSSERLRDISAQLAVFEF